MDYPSIFSSDLKPARDFLSLLPHGGRVLDFGCGFGRNAIALSDSGFKVEVYDLSTNAVSLCLKWADLRRQQIRAIPIKGGRLDCPPGRFDGILAWSVFDHMDLPQAQSAISELTRVSSQKCTLLLSFDEPGDAGGQPHEVLPDGTVRITKGARAGKLIRWYSEDEIRALMADAWNILEFSSDASTKGRVVLCQRPK